MYIYMEKLFNSYNLPRRWRCNRVPFPLLGTYSLISIENFLKMEQLPHCRARPLGGVISHWLVDPHAIGWFRGHNDFPQWASELTYCSVAKATHGEASIAMQPIIGNHSFSGKKRWKTLLKFFLFYEKLIYSTPSWKCMTKM